MIRAALLGYGYWGPNIARNIVWNKSYKLTTICDLDKNHLSHAKKLYPDISITTNADDVFSDKTIDAIFIATPISTHFTLSKKALLSGKHVFVEKPLAATVVEAKELVDLQKKQKRTLMVDHTFIYTPAVTTIKTYIDRGELGHILYFDSMRTNLGLFQEDANVLWDLAAHDLSIVHYLFGKNPHTISSIGVSHTKNNIESLSYTTITYSGNFIAHINCSWSSPVKLRRILIGGTKKMIVYDDVEPTEKVKIYDTGFTVKKTEKNKMMIDYRVGDIHIPKLELKEALLTAIEDFAHAIVSKKKIRSDGLFGAEIVNVLSLAEASMKKKGETIYVKNKRF